MDLDNLRALLEQVRAGGVDVDAAMERMRHLPFEDLGFAKVDHHRALRHGIPEVVFGKVSSLVRRDYHRTEHGSGGEGNDCGCLGGNK